VINQNNPRLPITTYAAKNTNENVRNNSSSGGIFTSLAEYVIEQGGVVFGAAYDIDYEVCHISVETKEDLFKLRGSKYVQSRIGDIYRHVKSILNEGRLVLFSGTPCQIAALNRFLGKAYDNLIKVDVVCHGAPSPFVWKSYLKNLKSYAPDKEIGEISFRDKSTGWADYSFLVKSDNEEIIFQERHNINLYMRLFLHNLSIRPSCFSCPTKNGQSDSDITLGDYWGIEKIHPDFKDQSGVSVVLINSRKGEDIFNSIDTIKLKSKYSDIVKNNPCIEKSAPYNIHYETFWSAYKESELKKAHKILNKCRPSLFKRVCNKIKTIIGV
jgi:coenzyme F420-reducing hydrogenase beta subunit